MHGKEVTEMMAPSFYSTGIFALDIALRGGFPYNRIVEVIGEESTCKSTLMALACNNFLKENPNGMVVDVDLENSRDTGWMKRLGCRLDKGYVLVNANSGEEAGDIVDEVVASHTIPVLVILDSIMCMVPENELESTMDSHFVGAMPSLINRVIRVCNQRLKACKVGAAERTSVLLVNQTRPKIGSFVPMMDSSGGQVRKFLSSQRIQFSNGSTKDMKEERKVGDFSITQRFARKINFQIIKNKTGGPEETGHFNFYQRTSTEAPFGMDNGDATMNYGLLYGILRRGGRSVYVGKVKLGASEAEVLKTLREESEITRSVRKQIMDAAIASGIEENDAPAESAKKKVKIKFGGRK